MSTVTKVLGRAEMRALGNYNSATTYMKGDSVLYPTSSSGDGCSYVAKVDNLVNVTPGSDATKWAKMVERGENGTSGLMPAASSQPSGGMLPNVYYNLGTLSGDTTFTFNTTGLDTTVLNHWYFVFTTPSTAPTITWPNEITNWYGGTPTIAASKTYHVSVIDGLAVIAAF